MPKFTTSTNGVTIKTTTTVDGKQYKRKYLSNGRFVLVEDLDNKTVNNEETSSEQVLQDSEDKTV